MPVDAINQNQSQTQPVQNKNINLSPDEFSKILEKLKGGHATTTNQQEEAPLKSKNLNAEQNLPLSQQNDAKQIKQKPLPIIIKTIKKPVAKPLTESENESIVKIGTINKNTPTISHLLKNNPDYQKDAWNIILSDTNKSKDFNRIRTGTIVSINTATNELLWEGPPPKDAPIPIPQNLEPERLTESGQIIIGEISKDSPTVSHLLKKNSFYGDYAWKIIFTDINKNKPYSTLTTGKIVTINPETYELSFVNKKDIKTTKEISAATAQVLKSFATNFFNEKNDFSSRLANSVKSYIGTPYNNIDCYGLIVRGLQQQGINYSGPGGIRERMEKYAMEQGLPLNAYQNGEGLVETSGTKLYGKSYIKVTDAEKQSYELLNDIQPILEEGLVLSFSTQSRGHTGIISNKNNEWTYVNSGVIDNQVDFGNSSQRVGEERLKDELENWFKLAESKNESLKVSVGKLDEEKLINGNNLIAQFNL